jgi:uncharacterized protein (TIGR02285 family)
MKFPVAVLLAGLLPIAVQAAQATQSAVTAPITVAWRNKPPMHYTENGVEQGYLLERAKQVFATAGIPASFVQEPSKRIWANFASGTKSYCSFGWYRLPEREAVVQYSTVFHTDDPPVVLVSPNAADKVRTHRSLASLLADQTLTLGVVDGVSYGAALDNLFKSASRVERRIVEPVQMARMVAANRLSYMIIGRDDLDYASRHDPMLRDAVRVDFADWPPGINLHRYIVCSKDVSAATMAKINKAIDRVMSAKKAPRKAGAQ